MRVSEVGVLLDDGSEWASTVEGELFFWGSEKEIEDAAFEAVVVEEGL